MKKIVLLFFVVCAAMTVNAQVYVGGSLGFWDNDDLDYTSYKIVPEIGYTLNDNWALGMELGYTHEELGENEREVFHVAPYARYSYLNSGIVSLFVDGGFGFSTIKDGDNGFEIGLKPGIALKLTDRFSLVSKFGFLGYRKDYAGSELGGGKEFGFDLTNSLSLGFFVNF